MFYGVIVRTYWMALVPLVSLRIVLLWGCTVKSVTLTIVQILFSCPLGSWVSLWNFITLKGSLMKPKWQKLASLTQEICALWFQFFGAVFASKGYPFKNIFYFTTAGDWDCVAAVERLPALHFSVDFIFLSFGILGFIVEL